MASSIKFGKPERPYRPLLGPFIQVLPPTGPPIKNNRGRPRTRPDKPPKATRRAERTPPPPKATRPAKRTK